MSQQSVDDFLTGGSRAPSAKFPTVGTTIKGVVLGKEMQQQRDIATGEPKTWADGNPQMQAVITLQTDERDASIEDDDGQRRVFAKGNMVAAIRDAVKDAGKKQLDIGDELAVKYVGDGEAKTRGFSPPKLFKAKVTPGTPPKTANPDEFF